MEVHSLGGASELRAMGPSVYTVDLQIVIYPEKIPVGLGAIQDLLMEGQDAADALIAFGMYLANEQAGEK